MESKNTFILHETEAFMRGELDNVTVAHGRIVLDLVSGGHVPYGCYTSPAVPLPTFDALRVSWNAGTPPGTAVEAQARVMVDGQLDQLVQLWPLEPLSGARRRSPRDQRRCKPAAGQPCAGQQNRHPGPAAHLPVYQRRTHHPFRQPGGGQRASGRCDPRGRAAHQRTPAPDALCRCAARPGAAAVMDLAICLASLTTAGRRYPARRICPCHARLPQY